MTWLRQYNSLRKALLIFPALIIFIAVFAVNPRGHKAPPETYTRPKPTKPLKPQIPSADRYQSGKVFLEEADSLYTLPEWGADRQILKGNVKFRQGSMFMYCDSAYYYPERNSMDAFGNVRMNQGDTLKVFADVLYYDGDVKLARLRTRGVRKVRLQNRDVSLTTDSLDYSLMQELGWYDCGGTLADPLNILTSQRGQYSPATKIAEFSGNVRLENKKDGYTLENERLVYSTATRIASIDVETRISGANDTIVTSRGEYDTKSGSADLQSRSTIIHRDSAGNVVTLLGDSIIYDNLSRVSKAYTFRDPSKDQLPVVLTDTARKAILIGGFGLYNDSTREAYAAENPILKEYSRPDTLFLRADTIYTKIIDNPAFSPGDSIPAEFHYASAWPRARFFRQDIQGIADTIRINQADSVLRMIRKPIVWNGERQVYGNMILIHLQDTAADWARLPDYGMVAEHIDEDFYNQMTGKSLFLTFDNGSLKRLEADTNVRVVFLPMEKDSTYNKLVFAESAHLTADMTGRELDKLKMWPEVSGKVAPVGDARSDIKFLPGFHWLESIRPKRFWYGDTLKWEDELGDLPDDLIEYFNNPENLLPGRITDK